MKDSRSGARSSLRLDGYRPNARRYDEVLDEAGAVRPQWQGLLERLLAVDLRQNAQRYQQQTRRLIAENGVTYNVYADTRGADRPWTLDPLPLLLTAADWRQIEQGVRQRARLLNTLLLDLYGPQRLLAEGVVPAQLPFGHPNFLWPCHGIVPRDGTWLHLYAVDLTRGIDGRWWVLADRTQAPSGAGYALENREIIEQVLPQAISDLAVRRVRPFFAELRERLLASFASREEGLAVVLTPGPFNETYFEHAYLAHQLGWPLVEGADLTVRQDTVFLKTLGGLRRVEAIIRRVDDDYCDPLELRSGSALGVPGLLGAVRAGRVLLANPLGTGVLESPAWLGFMPTIAQRLLGEDLRLPSVATWWCGERPALDYVIDHLPEVVIRGVFPNQRLEPVLGSALSAEARARLVERLRAQPDLYAAQEHVALSQSAALSNEGGAVLEARPLAIRVYALATPEGYQVMPGGLARVAAEGALEVLSNQQGGGSKDVWVLGETRAAKTEVSGSWRMASAQLYEPPLPANDDVPSRLVENLYWFGRYSARCEDKARLLRATLAVRSDVERYPQAVEFCRELDTAQIEPDPNQPWQDAAVAQGILLDVQRLTRCASQIRSRLSASAWRTLAELQRQLQNTARLRRDPREAIENLLMSLAAFAGLALDDMRQDEGWRLLSIGRHIERLQFLTAMLALQLTRDEAADAAALEWLLEACDCLRIYRTRYASVPRLGPLLDLLVRDAEHPRSLAFRCRAVASDLATLPQPRSTQTLESLAQSLPRLNAGDLGALERDAPEMRARLASQLQRLGEAAERLSDRLSMRYFSHTDAQALAS